MAFVAIESVRDAELAAQRCIELAQKSADEAVIIAQNKADGIIAAAQEEADRAVSVSADKASAQADEIIVTARNHAVLEADKLKKDCAAKQNSVNEAIINLLA